MNSSTGVAARVCAVEILARILDHAAPFDESVLRHSALRELEERDRQFARLLVMTALRRKGQADMLLAQMLDKPLAGKNHTVMHCLRLGAVQLLWLQTPPHAAVSAMVDTAVALGCAPMKGLVNAVLKRVAKEGPAIAQAQDEAAVNVPQWLHRSWIKAYGAETARAIALSRLAEPPLDISVKEDGAGWAARWGGVALPTGSVRLAQAGRVDALPGYGEGAWWVQDAGAALPALLLGNVRGLKVLDICAAPGGKTAQMAAAGAQVTALDKSRQRLTRLKANMQRLKLDVDVVEADALSWRPDGPFDALLLDAPCSATGTLRRHPEVVWTRSEKDIARLAQLQKRMLAHVSQWLKPGGKMVYCVCSLQPEEGEKQAEAFLARHPQFAPCRDGATPPALAPFMAESGALRTHPGFAGEERKMDGFYAICLQRLK